MIDTQLEIKETEELGAAVAEELKVEDPPKEKAEALLGDKDAN